MDIVERVEMLKIVEMAKIIIDAVEMLGLSWGVSWSTVLLKIVEMVEICCHLVDYVGGNRELGGNSGNGRYVWSVGGLCKFKYLKLWE